MGNARNDSFSFDRLIKLVARGYNLLRALEIRLDRRDKVSLLLPVFRELGVVPSASGGVFLLTNRSWTILVVVNYRRSLMTDWGGPVEVEIYKNNRKDIGWGHAGLK